MTRRILSILAAALLTLSLTGAALALPANPGRHAPQAHPATCDNTPARHAGGHAYGHGNGYGHGHGNANRPCAVVTNPAAHAAPAHVSSTTIVVALNDLLGS
ncbi:MAG: hypothetical protein AB7D51_01270 [Desulfovibrionaceae bacterium]